MIWSESEEQVDQDEEEKQPDDEVAEDEMPELKEITQKMSSIKQEF